MTSDAPLISIALPTYNAGKYLRQSVLSIIRQTYTNWELIICDDGSSDGSIDSISDICDSRIRILQNNTNQGVTVRLNQCISMARGEYFARMDQDDISYPMRLELQLNFLVNNPEIDLVATKCIAIDGNNQFIGLITARCIHEDICSKTWLGISMPHPTWIGKTSWFRKFKYAIPGPYFCDDQELLLRAYKESRYACVDKVLFAYRVRDRINLVRNFKIRFAILAIQLNIFSSDRKWIFCLLASFACLAKIVNDGFRTLLKGRPTSTTRFLSNAHRKEWVKMLENYS